MWPLFDDNPFCWIWRYGNLRSYHGDALHKVSRIRTTELWFRVQMHIICSLQCVKRSCYFYTLYSAFPAFKDHYEHLVWESLKCGNFRRLQDRASWYISIVEPTRCISFSNLFYFVVALYIFRTVFPSIIMSLRLYIQHQAYVTQILLTAC